MNEKRRALPPTIGNEIIWEFFLLAHDRETGEPIGGPPRPNGSAHFKMNVAPFWYVLSFVQEGVEPSFSHEDPKDNGEGFAQLVAYELAWAFKADVFGRPEPKNIAKALQTFPYWANFPPFLLMAPANCQLCFRPLEKGQKGEHPDCALLESHNDGEGGLS